MAPQTVRAGPRGDAETGSQNAAMLDGLHILSATDPESNQEKTASEDRRPSASGLSVAVRECRKRVALDDIWRALSPVSRDAEAALLCIENDDDDGLEHHLRRVVDDVRKAAQKYKELRALLAEPGRVRQ
jgi:hypothetical protein